MKLLLLVQHLQSSIEGEGLRTVAWFWILLSMVITVFRMLYLWMREKYKKRTD